MKKIWVYLLGVLTGIVIAVLISVIIVSVRNSSNGTTFFEQPGELINETSFRVFQSLGDGAALANGKGSGMIIYNGLTVLLMNDDGIPYYDEQIIELPEGKCFRQVGIYHYPAKSGFDKTVPIVMIMDK